MAPAGPVALARPGQGRRAGPVLHGDASTGVEGHAEIQYLHELEAEDRKEYGMAQPLEPPEQSSTAGIWFSLPNLWVYYIPSTFLFDTHGSKVGSPRCSIVRLLRQGCCDFRDSTGQGEVYKNNLFVYVRR